MSKLHLNNIYIYDALCILLRLSAFYICMQDFLVLPTIEKRAYITGLGLPGWKRRSFLWKHWPAHQPTFPHSWECRYLATKCYRFYKKRNLRQQSKTFSYKRQRRLAKTSQNKLSRLVKRANLMSVTTQQPFLCCETLKLFFLLLARETTSRCYNYDREMMSGAMFNQCWICTFYFSNYLKWRNSTATSGRQESGTACFYLSFEISGCIFFSPGCICLSSPPSPPDSPSSLPKPNYPHVSHLPLICPGPARGFKPLLFQKPVWCHRVAEKWKNENSRHQFITLTWCAFSAFSDW